MATLIAHSTVAAMVADTALVVGDIVETAGYANPDGVGANRYLIVAAGTGVVDGGSFIDLGNGFQAKGLFPYGYLDVNQFGHSGTYDIDDATTNAIFDAAAQYSNSIGIAQGSGEGTGPIVDVRPGQYRLTSPVPTRAVWRVAANTVWRDVGPIQPTFQRDTENLSGKIIRISGTEQSSLFYAGDPRYKQMKIGGRAFGAPIMGWSSSSNAGGSFTTMASDANADDQSCIGLVVAAVNDNTEHARSAWSVYNEFTRMEGVQGNAFGFEVTGYNSADLQSRSPYQLSGNNAGTTYGFWMSAGGLYGENQELSGDVPLSGVMAVLGKDGGSWDRGFVFFDGALVTGEMLSGAEYMSVAWYAENQPGRVAFVDAGHHQMWALNAAPVDTRLSTWDDGMPTGSVIDRSTVQVRVNGQDQTELYEESVVTTGAFVGQKANVEKRQRIMRAATGEFTEFATSATYIAPTDNLVSLGLAQKRFKQVNAVLGENVTSDERAKENIQDIPDVVLDAWSKVQYKLYRLRVGDERLHAGVIAQQVISVFADHGLDALEYGIVEHAEWDGGDRYSVSYTEAGVLEHALMRRYMNKRAGSGFIKAIVKFIKDRLESK